VPSSADAGGWITHPDAASPVVLEFRREIDLARAPARLPVEVTADNRFILEVNGRLVGRGPSTGTIARWRFSRVDLAPHLRKGHNEITAVVWNHGKFAPLAQQSVATGFRLTGAEFGTDAPGWKVRVDTSRSVISGSELLRPEYYVASAPEVIDAGKKPSGWVDAVPAPDAAKRTLIADPLPPQRETGAAPGETVRSSLAAAA
jgi:hypothetical protein